MSDAVQPRRRRRDSASARCLRALEAARAVHPELGKPLTWNGARAICRRMGVPIIWRRMPRDARVVAPLGTPVIVLNPDVPPRRHTAVLAHEIAHVFMHLDARDVVVFNLDACWPDDPREDEAEVLAILMLGGPEFSRHF